MLPLTSATITLLYGSHVQITSPLATFCPSFTFKYSTIRNVHGVQHKRSDFTSKFLISPVRPITTCIFLPSALSVLTVRKPSNCNVPSNLAYKEDSTEAEPATPPTWKVRSVTAFPAHRLIAQQ